MLKLNTARLVSLATPDSNITHIQQSDPRLFNAIKNLSLATQQIINNNFPAAPIAVNEGSIIVPGIIAVASNVLSHNHTIVLPTDPTGNWVCSSITLVGVTSTLVVAPASASLIMDITVSQIHGTTPYKTIFQLGGSPTVPIGIFTTHNVMFAINTLYDGDVCQVPCRQADAVASGLEMRVMGYYNWVNQTEKQP